MILIHLGIDCDSKSLLCSFSALPLEDLVPPIYFLIDSYRVVIVFMYFRLSVQITCNKSSSPHFPVHGFASVSYTVMEGENLNTVFEHNVKGTTNLPGLEILGTITSLADTASECVINLP